MKKHFIMKAVTFALSLMLLMGTIPTLVIAEDTKAELNEFLAPTSHLTSVPSGYTAIRSAADLAKVRANLAGKYILMNDIDMGFASFAPIGEYDVDELSSAYTFSGVFDGNGYTISNLYIYVAGTKAEVYAGMFAAVSGEVKNLCLTGNITAQTSKTSYAGA
ncbi:MAG: hypothetical protein J5940_01960, partial [Clostridia bacterium]|nr:hypothetical protein [Clostridia bacterium]